MYSNRIELKQWMREDERDPGRLGESALRKRFRRAHEKPGQSRWQAWEPVLFNQAHDLTSGTMVDKVYDDTIVTTSLQKKWAADWQDSLDAVSAKIDTAATKPAESLFSSLITLGWTRSDVAHAEVGFSDGGVTDT